MSTNPIDIAVEELRSEVEKNTTIGASAIAFIQGVPGLVEAAYQKGLAEGASPATLEALASLKTTLSAETQAFVDALPVNTPEDPARKRR